MYSKIRAETVVLYVFQRKVGELAGRWEDAVGPIHGPDVFNGDRHTFLLVRVENRR